MDASHRDEAFREFLRILADLDDMSIEDFFKRLLGKQKMPGTSATKVAVNPIDIVNKLRPAFSNDEAFHREMDNIGANKAVTKPVLTKVFYALFDRTRGVPSKATRSDLLRLIEDERNILVRNEKMGKLLGRRIVPAE